MIKNNEYTLPYNQTTALKNMTDMQAHIHNLKNR